MRGKDQKTSVETISLSVPSVPKYLRLVRCLIAELADSKGFSLKDRDRICLAVGEACSNIIRHSYKEKPDELIIIKCELYADRMTISIRDFGEKIDLSRIPSPECSDVRPGGLGVHMIRCMMDEVEYDITHEVGTEIHMTKLLRPSEKQNAS